MKDAKGHGSNGRGGAGKMPIPGHSFHTKSDAQLRYIAKDAADAARATRGMSMYDPNSHTRQDTEGKYLDQVNDASTVLAYRARGGAQVVPQLGAMNAAGDTHPKSGTVPVHAGASGRSVPIFDRSGALHGHVSKQSTSIGASQAAGGPVEYASHPTHGWGWRKK